MVVVQSRRLALVVFAVPLVALAAEAQPPVWEGTPAALPISPEKLRADTNLLAKERLTVAEGPTSERDRMRAELLAVLKRINESPTLPLIPGPRTGANPAPPVPTAKSPPEPLDTSKPLDTLRLAMNLYRDNDFEAAQRSFRQLDPSQLGREDRAFVRYMTACSLRRLNRTAEASAIFTEVANSQEDEFVAACAVWQLSMLRSTQELEAQLEQLRARAKLK